jgi:hypothetical protein
MTRDEYKAIAEQAVDLLCFIGYLGLHPSRQRELWQRALDLDRKLHPAFPPVVVWTEEEGDIDPPRRPEAKAAPSGTVTITDAPDYTPPEPFRMSAEAEHLARYCTGSGCRSPLHRDDRSPPAPIG